MAALILNDTLDVETLLERIPLWRPQQDAVQFMRRYISAYWHGETEKSALVHMPTGSGKTGVIAALTRCVPEVGCAVVLTPRVALRRQLLSDIQSRFFKHLDPPPDPDKLPKQVIEITENEQILKI